MAEDSLELFDLGLELFRKLQLEELPVLAAGHHLGKKLGSNPFSRLIPLSL